MPNESLGLFSMEKKKYTTQYSDLFPEEPLLFLHQTVFYTLSGKWNFLDRGCFKNIDLEAFVDLLERNQENFAKLFNQNQPIPVNQTDSELVTWLRRFWKYLCDARKKAEEKKRPTKSTFNLALLHNWSLALVHQNEAKYLISI